MSSGREFHTVGLEIRKLLGQKRRVLVRGMVRCPPRRRTKVGSRPDFRDGDAGSTEISRVTAVERVSNEGCNFEDDALADGKPMKLIPEHRRDVVEFPCIRDQPGRRVENGLQSSQDSARGSVEYAVAVVHAT